MARRSVIIRDYKTNEPNKVIEITVYYLKGGANLFGERSKPRGYYISACPVGLISESARSYTLFAGVCRLLEESNRFSAKRLDHWVLRSRVSVDLQHDEIMHLVNQVLAESKLTLEETTCAAS